MVLRNTALPTFLASLHYSLSCCLRGRASGACNDVGYGARCA